ncbi:hypothetical protein AB0O91_00690 [Kitasatospora sp. NPDC089797]
MPAPRPATGPAPALAPVAERPVRDVAIRPARWSGGHFADVCGIAGGR